MDYPNSLRSETSDKQQLARTSANIDIYFYNVYVTNTLIFFKKGEIKLRNEKNLCIE